MASSPDQFSLPDLIPLYIDGANKAHNAVLKDQLTHRINLIKNVWCVPNGARVLEIGCGQGDCTLVLASAVGESGRVVAVDPADLGYGSPYTLGQAQSHLKSGPLGNRLDFVKADPMDYLSQTFSSGAGEKFTHVILCHSVWYFSTPELIRALLTQLVSLQKKRLVYKICIAEWSLSPSPSEALAEKSTPHVLAALARGTLEALRRESGGAESSENIRSAVSPNWLKKCIADAGGMLSTDVMVSAPEGMRDGVWETQGVLGAEFRTSVESLNVGEDVKVMLLGMGEATHGAVQRLPGGVKSVECMAVWCCVA